MNHDIRPGRSRQSGTTPPMNLPLQPQLKGQLPNMHGQHPAATVGPHIIFSNVIGLLLGDHNHVSAMSLPQSTEMDFAVAIGH